MWIREGNSAALVGENGTVQAWQVNGRHVLLPEEWRDVGGKMKLRGGIPLCAPIFGNVATSHEHIRNYPQHGPVRLGFMPSHLYDGFSISRMVSCSGADFPWNFIVDVDISLVGRILSHQLRLTNITDEREWRLGAMPVRPGIIVYLNTPRGIDIDSGRSLRCVGENTDKLDELCLLPSNQHINVFARNVGNITIKVEGYTYLNLWRDKHDFLGIELIAGDPDKLDEVLESGAFKNFEAVFEFEPT